MFMYQNFQIRWPERFEDMQREMIQNIIIQCGFATYIYKLVTIKMGQKPAALQNIKPFSK